MQRAGQSLVQGLKDLPLIHSYNNLQALTKNINESDREHDLIIASYVLGEIPSLKDRITIVRQLWELTLDVLVLIEPGPPHGSNIISQMRSHILRIDKRKCHKVQKNDASFKDLVSVKSGDFIVAPHFYCSVLMMGIVLCENMENIAILLSVCRGLHYNVLTGTRRASHQCVALKTINFSFVAFRRGPRPSLVFSEDQMEQDQAVAVPHEEVDPTMILMSLKLTALMKMMKMRKKSKKKWLVLILGAVGEG